MSHASLLCAQTVVTCMEVMNKNLPNERAISCLIVGTESRHVIIMEPSGVAINQKVGSRPHAPGP
jgi:hypothetical protein